MTDSSDAPANGPIPFNRPPLVPAGMDYVQAALRDGHASSGGPFTGRCETLLETSLDIEHVLLTTSGSAALELTAILLDIGPGDEVIMPTYTYPSTANAVVLRGAKPVFVDVRADTLNLDEGKLPAAITERTRAIMVVHYAGVGCEMDEITRITQEHDIPLIEDNAHGLYGRYKDRALGKFGGLAALSFHETKNFSSGEGGALIVNDPALLARANVLCDKGTNRQLFLAGQVDKYSWVDVGSSYRLSDLLAAYLLAQLEIKESILSRRHQLWRRYADDLSKWALDYGVGLPQVPEHCQHPAHMFYLILPGPVDRDAFIAHLATRGVMSVFHFVPLHLSAMGRHFDLKEGDLPVAEAYSQRIARLPLYVDLTDAEQDRVIDAVLDFRPTGANRAV